LLALPPPLLTLPPPPPQYEENRCPRDVPVDTPLQITITGTNFGKEQATVFIGGRRCIKGDPSDNFHSEVKAYLPRGSGDLKNVMVLQLGGEVSDGVGLVNYQRCAPGQENKEIDGYFQCMNCTSGWYTDTIDAILCIECPKDSFTNAPHHCEACSTWADDSVTEKPGANR